MSDPRFERWAQTLVNYSVNVQPGQTVAITGGIAAEPLMRSIYREVIKAGGFPVALPAFSGLGADLLKMGSDDQLGYISPVERFMREQTDVMIAIMADTNTKAMASVDPARQQFFQGARRELFQTYLQPRCRWLAELDPDALSDRRLRAGRRHVDRRIRRVRLPGLQARQPTTRSPPGRRRPSRQQRIVDWLHGKQEIHLTGPDTDLRVSDRRAGSGSTPAMAQRTSRTARSSPARSRTRVNGTSASASRSSTAGREIEEIRPSFRARQGGRGAAPRRTRNS